MSLETYQEKRNFNQTPEPDSRQKFHTGDPVFVVQRHDASHLHFDFRLEYDGVLKSWAVPKGVSMNPSVKRLAIMVEDHPLDYANFSGEIPKGNYGAGTVEIWDNGIWHPDKDFMDVGKALKEGLLEFHLKGEKLKGGFVLVRLDNGNIKDGWLLIKRKEKITSPDLA